MSMYVCVIEFLWIQSGPYFVTAAKSFLTMAFFVVTSSWGHFRKYMPYFLKASVVILLTSPTLMPHMAKGPIRSMSSAENDVFCVSYGKEFRAQRLTEEYSK